MRPSSRFPVSRILPAIGLTGLLALAACAKTEPVVTGSVPHDGYKTRHPIVVAEGPEIIDIPVGSQMARLPEREAGTVLAFGEEARDNGAATMTILVPRGSANQAAAARVSREIGQIAQRGSGGGVRVSFQSYFAGDQGADAPVRLAYPRMKAAVEHRCGQWGEQVWMTKENTDYWNFGCATQTNLAAMVVDPADLVTPRGMTAASTNRRKTIFEKYEKGEKTTTEQTLENQGQIANVAGGG